MVGYPVPRSTASMVGVLPWSAQMPRYYFHIEESGVTFDDEGTELCDHEAARVFCAETWWPATTASRPL